jgi:hypothetical protein
MNTDQRYRGTDGTAAHGQGDAAARPMGVRQAFREIRRGIVMMWWGFFDWVAVVSWKAMAGRAPCRTNGRKASARSACCAGLSRTSPSSKTRWRTPGGARAARERQDLRVA